MKFEITQIFLIDGSETKALNLLKRYAIIAVRPGGIDLDILKEKQRQNQYKIFN